LDFAPLPEDEGSAIEVLAERIQGLQRNLETTTADIRKNGGSDARRLDALEGRVLAEVDRLDRTNRRVAIDGLWLESVGLVMVAIGMFLQLIDGLIS
jgi:hypothetical protein